MITILFVCATLFSATHIAKAPGHGPMPAEIKEYFDSGMCKAFGFRAPVPADAYEVVDVVTDADGERYAVISIPNPNGRGTFFSIVHEQKLLNGREA